MDKRPETFPRIRPFKKTLTFDSKTQEWSIEAMIRSFILFLLMLSLVACTKKDPVQSKVLPAGQKMEFLVGTDAAYAPFESETADKRIEGFDVDIIQAIAAKAGIQLKIINTPWEGLFNQLDSGDRDILISAITINEERRKVMEFSDPYFEAVQMIAVPQNSTVTRFTDLKNLKVGVQTGTTGDDIASKLMGKNNSNIKRFEGTPLALQELAGGGVDAVVADNGVIINFLKNNKKTFKIVSDSSFSKENYGIAVKKGQIDLLKKINDGLAAIKKDGTYERIYKVYFGDQKE